MRVASRRLPRPVAQMARAVLDWLLGFRGFNEIYRHLPACEPAGFPRLYLDAIKVDVTHDGEALEAVPRTGPLIVIANHPMGLVEGLALDSLLLTVRRDVAVMMVHQLAAIPECAARHVFVDPSGRRSRRHLSRRGWREAFARVARGGVLIVFPAGQAAAFEWRRMAVVEQPWSRHIAALARRTGAAVLPVFVQGRNSVGYHLACSICPPLKNVLAVRELSNKRGRTLRLTVGRIIPVDELRRFPDDEGAIAYLRQQTGITARK
jgi:putative hemolysin